MIAVGVFMPAAYNNITLYAPSIKIAVPNEAIIEQLLIFLPTVSESALGREFHANQPDLILI